MGLRPARTIHHPIGQVWARISQKKPRKSYVKGAPHPKVRQYDMGALKGYEIEVDLIADAEVQLRDNALEAARMMANKYLEKHVSGNYYLKLRKYPHYVVREHSALGVAGADRISKGMKLAFGKPKGRALKLLAGEILFSARVAKKDLTIVKEAFRRAKLKLSGSYHSTFRELTEQEKAVQVVKEFKKVEVPVAAPLPAVEEAKAGEEKEEEKKAEGEEKKAAGKEKK
ncbi:50S ribosomal protein L16 [Candidatus Micrarchaeota archaeon]|nr:50S ribosomal protein L16 [Candidatus Micrarchaeota archaeon]